jgi:hypothetical protein
VQQTVAILERFAQPLENPVIWTYRVYAPVRVQTPTNGNLGTTCGTSVTPFAGEHRQRFPGRKQLWAPGFADGAIHTAPTEHATIGRIDNGVHLAIHHATLGDHDKPPCFEPVHCARYHISPSLPERGRTWLRGEQGSGGGGAAFADHERCGEGKARREDGDAVDVQGHVLLFQTRRAADVNHRALARIMQNTGQLPLLCLTRNSYPSATASSEWTAALCLSAPWARG